MKISFTRNNWFSVAGILILLLSWELIARGVDSRNILPGPVFTLKTLFTLVGEPSFYNSLGLTLFRGIVGFLIALMLSLLVGIPSGLNPRIEAFLSPFLVTIRSTPVISIILLAIIWLRVEKVPVFIGFLTMFPILTTNLTAGIREVDKGLLQMAQIYNVRSLRIFSDIYFPSITPFLTSGLLTAIGFGWRAVIIGEVLSQPRYGIGSMMQDAQSYLLVAELISWTLVAVIIGFIFERSIGMISRKTENWK
jgi:NitT/TauT family transport system permease protein